jgi:N utilization substance protein B
MRRRQAREFVLTALYQREFREISLEELFAGADPGDQRGYIEQVFSGVLAHQEELDARIGERTVGWRFERLARIDRNILRLATYELLYLPEVPPEVAIDEAVELCKKYGTENAQVFVNGILDRIWKETVEPERVNNSSTGEGAAGQAKAQFGDAASSS